MDISIDRVKDSEHEALANLMKMYCYEWSQYNLFDHAVWTDGSGSTPCTGYYKHFYHSIVYHLSGRCLAAAPRKL